MSAIHPFYYRTYDRAIRKLVHDTHKEKREFPIHKTEVAKPKFVTQTDGRKVRYEGP